MTNKDLRRKIKRRENNIKSASVNGKYSETDIKQMQAEIDYYRAMLKPHEQKEGRKRNSAYLKQRAKALERDNGTCVVCGNKEAVMHVHHILPRAKGGDEHIDNLETLCELCHLHKHKDDSIYPLMLSRYIKSHS